MKRAVLFDFDDTLADFSAAASARQPAKLFEKGASNCYAFLSAHERSLPLFDTFCRQQRWIRRRVEWTARLTGGEPDMRRFLRRICKDYGLQRDENSLATLGWLWYEPITTYATVAPDVIPTLAALCDAGLDLGLIINTPYPGRVIDRHLEDLGLLEFFPTRIYSTDLATRKPDPRMFQAALDAMNIPAHETLYVGDDPKSDIAAAKRLGLTTVLRGSAESTAADHTIRQLSELLDLPELQNARTPAHTNSPAIPMLMIHH